METHNLHEQFVKLARQCKCVHRMSYRPQINYMRTLMVHEQKPKSMQIPTRLHRKYGLSITVHLRRQECDMRACYPETEGDGCAEHQEALAS